MAKATKHEEFLNDIAQANKVFAEHLQQVLPLWSKPVVSWSSNPTWLATKLSEKFPTLRFNVVYEKGAVTVTAAPFFKEFATPIGGQNAETLATAVDIVDFNFHVNSHERHALTVFVSPNYA